MASKRRVNEPAARRPDSGRTRRKAGDTTRRRLLRAAEKLFAQHGIDAVSLNEIVHASKVNAAAIHYHFGTREGLIAAVIEQRRPIWSERRMTMVADLAARDEITARDVICAMVEPVAALASHPWGEDYIKFLGHVASHSRYASILHGTGDYEYKPLYLKQFARVTPDLPEHIRLARFGYAHEFTYHALAASDQRVGMWLAFVSESPPRWTTDDLIDLLAGAITAPVHPPPEHHA
jgi:AcrR family transcriptional regulator